MYATLLLPILLTLSAAEPDPEPGDPTRAEPAIPAVDYKKAKDDPKLGVQIALHRVTSTNNLKQLGLALHNYHDANRAMPTDITGKDGKALLSWRVRLLPYLEQEALYKQLKLDEAWDSPHNKKLIDKMPAVFRSPRVKLKAKGLTVYQVFTGPNAVFGPGRALTFARITDGTSNTIFAVESSVAVPWTKPADLPFDRKKPVPDIGKAYGKRPLAVMFDGSVRVLDLERIKEETLKNAIDPADGNVLGPDW